MSLSKYICKVYNVHGKKKYSAGHMDRLLRKAAGPQQMLPVHALIENRHSQGS